MSVSTNHHEKINFPNVITFLRFLLVVVFLPLLCWFYLLGEAAGIFILMLVCIAAILDLIDGIVARKLDQCTSFGARLDEITDKLFLFLVPFVLWLAGLQIYPAVIGLWFLAMFREALVTYWRNRTVETISSSMWGKIKTACQMSALCIWSAQAAFPTIDEILLNISLIVFFIGTLIGLIGAYNYFILYKKKA